MNYFHLGSISLCNLWFEKQLCYSKYKSTRLILEQTNIFASRNTSTINWLSSKFNL